MDRDNAIQILSEPKVTIEGQPKQVAMLFKAMAMGIEALKKQADPLVEKLENVIDMAKSYQGCGEAERGLCFVADDLKKILEYVKEKELKVER